jgi:hypothetical protein
MKIVRAERRLRRLGDARREASGSRGSTIVVRAAARPRVGAPCGGGLARSPLEGFSHGIGNDTPWKH